MYQIAATLDIFKGQLTLKDVMTIELPLLTDLYNGRAKFLEDKRKIEEREMDRIKSQAATSQKKK
jgi:hypothetical protein